MLKISRDNAAPGFALTFDNGYTISVMFGRSNYCSNRDLSRSPVSPCPPEATTAEILAWDENGKDYTNWPVRFCAQVDGVMGWCAADEVADAIKHVASLKKSEVE